MPGTVVIGEIIPAPPTESFMKILMHISTVGRWPNTGEDGGSVDGVLLIVGKVVFESEGSVPVIWMN